MNVTSFSERKSGNDIITIIFLIGLHRISRHLIILLDGSPICKSWPLREILINFFHVDAFRYNYLEVIKKIEVQSETGLAHEIENSTENY